MGFMSQILLCLLPKLYIAYKTDLSKVSGKVLNIVRERWEQGDPHVVSTLENIAGVAGDGRAVIKNKDFDPLGRTYQPKFRLPNAHYEHYRTQSSHD